MKKRNCYLFVFEGYSDWEPSLAIAGLQQFTDFAVKTFSIDGKAVRSMGNVNVQPDFSLQQIKAEAVDLLILPGGEVWDKGANLEIKPLLNAVLDQEKLVAAICGATGFLGEQGYLDNVKHTSNHLDYYLKKVAPHYKGEEGYIKEHAVKDGNLITANGTAIVPFAETIFNHFNFLSDEKMSFWFQFFQHPEMISME
jgi:putative intracellular protease/amidase